MPAKLAVVIPICDEAETLPVLFRQLRRVLEVVHIGFTMLVTRVLRRCQQAMIARLKSETNRDKFRSLCIGPGHRLSQEPTAYVAC